MTTQAFWSGPGATCIMIASFGANLHLNTWLCYCSSAAGKLSTGAGGELELQPEQAQPWATLDKVMPSQGYHENCPATAGVGPDNFC